MENIKKIIFLFFTIILSLISVQAEDFRIHFNGNYGQGIMEDIDIPFSKEKQLDPNSFYKRGYEFIGWKKGLIESGYNYRVKYISSSKRKLGEGQISGIRNSTRQISAPDKVGYKTPSSQTINFNTDTKIITFTYPIIQYTISYDLKGGIMSNFMTSYNVESHEIILPKPTKTGYTFIGWTGDNGSAPQVSVRIPTGSTGNRKYIANWTPNQNVKYIVRHHQENILDNNYTLYETETKSGTVDSKILISNLKKSYTGFNFENAKVGVSKVEEVTIKPNGDLIVDIYYRRQLVELDVNGVINGQKRASLLDYGTFNIKINNETVLTDIQDYCNRSLKYGSSYEIYNIKSTPKSVYKGIYINSPPLKGVVDEYQVKVWLEFEDKPISYTYELIDGPSFNIKIKDIDAINGIKSIEFIDTKMPSNGITKITGVDLDGDGGIVGWYSVDPTDNMAKVYISTQKSGQKVIANQDSSHMLDGYVSFDKKVLKSIEYIDVSKLDVSKVNDMFGMFNYTGANAKTFEIKGLNTWNTHNVMNMQRLFYNTGTFSSEWNIGDLNNWDTSNVTDMSYMFCEAGKETKLWNIGDLGRWDVSSVKTFQSMFLNAGRHSEKWNLGSLDNWNVSNVTDMGNMFFCGGYDSREWNIGDLSKWNVSNVTNMSNMFRGVAGHKDNWTVGNLNDWDTSKVANMSGMFSNIARNANSFNIDLSNLKTNNVINMSDMFSGTGRNATNWNIGDLSNWNTSKVTRMTGMFSNAGENAKSFNIGKIGKWDVGNVNSMKNMFYHSWSKARNWELSIDTWNTSNVTDMKNMFAGAGKYSEKFKIDLSKWNVGNVNSMEEMFFYTGNEASTFSIGNISDWNVSKVTNMKNMFWFINNKANYSLNLSRWNVSNVTSYSGFKYYENNKIIEPKWK